MKKTFFLLAIVTLIVSLCACSQQDLEEMISDDVIEVKITHVLMGQLAEWTIEGDDIVPLQTWANGLEYESVAFEEGQTPGDAEGQETYWFELTGGDNPGFDYMICGPDDCYLIIESNWYIVNNPSNPPVKDVSQTENSNVVDAEEIEDTFGILVSLPPNSNWITEVEYELVDDNNLRITYYDLIADKDRTLLAAKNGSLDLPQNEYDEALNESWADTTINGQYILGT